MSGIILLIPRMLAHVKTAFDAQSLEARASMVATIDATTEDEMRAYQALQSTSFAGGKLPLETAQFLYETLGGECPTDTKWKALAIEQKIVALRLLGELARKAA
jgi:hypothetical protein